MIRMATEIDFPDQIDSECALRICALNRAYGCKTAFLRFYTDGKGTLLSVLDGVGILYCPNMVSEEWTVFLAMYPDIHTLHCSLKCGRTILSAGHWTGTEGVVMSYNGAPVEEPVGICPDPCLPAVYDLLKAHFPGVSPFDAWYPDASHRVRHDLCHIASVIEGERVISSAMSVAEAYGAALLGQVVTHPNHRRKGLAEKCLKSLIHRCKANPLYILPVDDYAQQLYEKLGFSVCDGWAELRKTAGGTRDNELSIL